MKRFSRRQMLSGMTTSGLALSLRSAITGIPMSFLLTGKAYAAGEGDPKITILSCSGAGEAVNVCGPGSFEPGLESYFEHPQANEVDAGDVGTVMVNGMALTAEHLEHGAQMALGDGSVTMAAAWEALPADLRQHLLFFHHRTNAGIHPQFPTVLTAHGGIQGMGGRGAEQLPAAIAQETAQILDTTTTTPFVLGSGAFSSEGAPLPSYAPMQAKTLASSVGNAVGGPENFGALYDHYIDQTYAQVKTSGTAEQKKFLDRHASSRVQATAFGEDLVQLLEGITDDSIESQLRTAVAMAKLKLAPVIITNFSFGGDNHSDFDLTNESNKTLHMIKALDALWQAAKSLDVVDDILYATLTVFGRDARRGAKGGRGHHGKLCTGMVLGSHIQGGVVGAMDTSSGQAVATGINTGTGTGADPDVLAEDTLYTYYKTLMLLAGVPADRRDERVPEGQDVTSMI